MAEVIELLSLPKAKVPAEFRVETYFDFRARPFRHSDLFQQRGVNNVVAAVRGIGAYVKSWLDAKLPRLAKERNPRVLVAALPAPTLSYGNFRILIEEGAEFAPSSIFGAQGNAAAGTLYVARGARVFGDIHLDRGDLYIGSGTRVERGATVQAPGIIGEHNDIRAGSYLRGDVILGDRGVFRGEMKNCVTMDNASFPHPSYVGDSLCGFGSHFGNQVTAANFGIFEGMRPMGKQRNARVKVGGRTYDLGSPKFGVVLGDFVQVGCNSVSDPATFLAPRTVVYPLTRINSGFYGPRVLLKNKPMEHGVIEVVPLDWQE